MIELLLTIAIIGFLVWLILKIPGIAPFSSIIVGVAVICVVIYLLQAFGIADIPVPRVRR